jgi:hypothetical protein
MQQAIGYKEVYKKNTSEVLSNSTLQIVFRKRRQEYSTLELHGHANMLTPSNMALFHPG